jgi:hypothetical protein
MPPVGFEPTIPVSERPQTHALDRAVPLRGIDEWWVFCVCPCCLVALIQAHICANVCNRGAFSYLGTAVNSSQRLCRHLWNSAKCKCASASASREQNGAKNHNIKIVTRSFESVEQFKYMGTTVIDKKIALMKKPRADCGNACYHSVQNLFCLDIWSPKI